MAEFLLPDLGEGLTEAEIVRWLVSVGDVVGTDQPVVEVETAKVTVEVPVPFAGVVTALHGAPGDVVPVGAVLVSVDTSRVSRDDAVGDGSGRVLVGYGTSSGTTRRRRASSGPRADERAAAPSRRATPHVAVVSPLVRRMARERGVDLGQIAGSGPEGIVLRRDVESAAAAERSAGAERRIPLRGIRKAMADKVTRSRREIPEATVWVDVDATDLLAARATLNRRSAEPPVSLLGLIARFALIGLHRFPELNARVEKELYMPYDSQITTRRCEVVHRAGAGEPAPLRGAAGVLPRRADPRPGRATVRLHPVGDGEPGPRAPCRSPRTVRAGAQARPAARGWRRPRTGPGAG